MGAECTITPMHHFAGSPALYRAVNVHSPAGIFIFVVPMAQGLCIAVCAVLVDKIRGLAAKVVRGCQ